MKLSLHWLLDHLPVTVQDIDVQDLFKKFTATTAEIDSLESVHTNLAELFVGSVETLTSECQLFIQETGKKISLPLRKDLISKGYYVVKKEGTSFRWASLLDCGSSKDGLLPQVSLTQDEAHGSWRGSVEQDDIIITIENKAITNRPDLWGHRGCAREIAALLGKKLRDDDLFFASKAIAHFPHTAPVKEGQAFALSLDDSNESYQSPCRRFATLYVPEIENRPSLLWMVFRLARIDARPHSMLVDLTNYVMFDIGQPMHVFDAQKLSTHTLAVRRAREGEALMLLDGETVTLTGSECVVTDSTTPVALAGIMGGEETSVTRSTKAILLESANFDATAIRRTATQHKKRTESSTRFEKSLDPNQNTLALLRYLQLLDTCGISYRAEDTITSLGAVVPEKIITVAHKKIESLIGMPISSDHVESILAKLEIGVERQGDSYTVTVPTFRSSKDIMIQEDIVEEVARFIGYRNIPHILPMRKMDSFDTRSIQRKRHIKHVLAYGLAMHEVQTYAVYEESFLKKLDFEPSGALVIKNPQSEQWKVLVTSLIPNLIKCVVLNESELESLRFFEINRVWFIEQHLTESQECAGIIYEKKNSVDFYEGKEAVERLFSSLGMSLVWVKPEKDLAPWYDAHQSAELWHGDRIVGKAGKIAKKFLSRVVEGDAFIFELDATVLLKGASEKNLFVPMPKYPSSEQDISILVPLSSTVQALEAALMACDERIVYVALIDSFEKPEWPGKKSLSFRITAASQEGTLSKDEIMIITHHIHRAVIALGADIR